MATPRDDCPYAKSNANTFVPSRAYRVFLTSCVGINLGDIPLGGCGTLGMSPRVIPTHSVGKPYTNSLVARVLFYFPTLFPGDPCDDPEGGLADPAHAGPGRPHGAAHSAARPDGGGACTAVQDQN